MTLQLFAMHFEGCDFNDVCNCPIAIAAKHQLKTDDVTEGVLEIKINGVKYRHEYYGIDDCEEDLIKAQHANFYPDVLIREIELTKKEPQHLNFCKNCGDPVNKFQDFCDDCLTDEEPDNENAHEDWEKGEARKRDERFK